MDIPQLQFSFTVPVDCRHGPDSAENRGVLHAVPDQVVGLPVVCNDSGGLVQTLSLEVPQLQLFFEDVDFPVVAQRLCAVAGVTGAVRGGGRRCVHAATSSSSSLCRMGLRFVHRHPCRTRLRGYVAAVLQHFSASVHLDVEAQGGGDAGSLTPGRSVTPIWCIL